MSIAINRITANLKLNERLVGAIIDLRPAHVLVLVRNDRKAAQAVQLTDYRGEVVPDLMIKYINSKGASWLVSCRLSGTSCISKTASEQKSPVLPATTLQPLFYSLSIIIIGGGGNLIASR